MVLMAIGITFILGAALLTNTITQEQVSFNQIRSYQADAIAEGGMNLAVYYLLNPSKAPVLNIYGYYSEQTGIALSSGTVTTKVSLVNNTIDTYKIVATGTAGTAQSLALSRTLTGTVVIRNAAITNAVTANGPLTIPSNFSITGNVSVNGALTVNTGAKITGSAMATTAGTNKGTITGGPIVLVTSPAISVTPNATLQNYLTYQYFNGVSWGTYSATNLFLYAPLGSLGGLFPITLGPTILNPAGIYYSYDDLALNGNVTIKGTLLLSGANLWIEGKNNYITGRNGYPALIVQGSIYMSGTNCGLTATGITWLSGAFKRSGGTSGSAMTINGALMFGGSAPSVDSNFGTLSVTYNGTYVTGVTHLNTANDTVQYQNWQQ